MNVNDIIATPTIIDVSAHCTGNGVAPMPHIPVEDVYMKEDINMPDFDGKRWDGQQYISIFRRLKRPRISTFDLPSIPAKKIDEISSKGFATVRMVVKHPNSTDRLVKMRMKMATDSDSESYSEDEDVVLEPFVKVRVTPL